MDTVIRLGVFIVMLVLMMSWEAYSPRRQLRYSRWQRWPINIGLSAITTLLLRFSIGGVAYFSAILMAEMQFGLLNLITLPLWLSVVVALVLFDLALYGQHLLLHRWPLLWRLHKVHHTDLDFDVTTAVRFHPVEILLSLIYKVVVISLLGPPALAVLIFELILSTSALFNHSNIGLPVTWDRRIRWLLVTPDMHRIHHSTVQQETDSNFGFSISLWDRLFGTYTIDPSLGQEGMNVGLSQYRHSPKVTLKKLLLMPFKS
ncbi:MAG: sterol desaturase/sphingolipid hydroxylase (fatty acid hydroxylase superfamily) [Methylophagaceae bacterium]